VSALVGYYWTEQNYMFRP